MQHLDENSVAALLEARLAPEERDEIEEHLSSCNECRELVATAALALSTGAPPRSSRRMDASRELGTTLGRYVILQTLGAGSMGVVYTAFDTTLDRKVAIKLLHPDPSQTPDERRNRLIAEAKAMAKLSDPHVVTVYEVGTFDDQVFLAMELVAGTTLTKWLAATGAQRETADVMGVLLRAGRGLAAAHRAGLIHRDFKPDNVLVDDQQRVRVTDFGLARSTLVDVRSPGGDRSDDLRHTRSLVGTPAYMAPEQMRGEAIDARADQYSFCVTAYEALTGVPPFDAKGFDDLLEQRSEGKIRPTNASAKIPVALMNTLRRGMDPDPSRRHASMDALLTELARDRSLLRRRASVALLVVATVVAALLIQHRIVSRSSLCESGDTRFASVWNENIAAQLREKFAASKLPYADRASGAVDAAFRAYGRAWSAMYRDSCEATRLRGSQSEALMDRRMSCLNRRLLDVDGAVSVLMSGDAAVIENAQRLALGVGAIDACAEKRVAEIGEGPALPIEVRAEIETSLIKAKNLIGAASYSAAVLPATHALTSARSRGDRWHEAEALLLLGEVTDRGGNPDDGARMLGDAIEAATITRQDDLAARIMAELVRVEGVRRAHPEIASLWERLAIAVVQRLGSPAGLEATVRYASGRSKRASGKYADAQRDLERAADRYRESTGDRSFDLAGVLNELGIVLRDLGEWESARAQQSNALSIQEELLGPEHPAVATTLRSLADLDWRSGKPFEAIPRLRRALEIQERALGDKHLEFAYTLNQLANVYASVDDFATAIGLYERACSIGARTLADDHPEGAMCRMNIAAAMVHLGRYDESKKILERSREVLEKHYGASHHFLGMIEGELGALSLARKDATEALAHFKRALDIDEHAVGVDHRDNADLLVGIAESLVELHRAKEAIPLAERAMDLRSKGGFPIQQAKPRFTLAKALWVTGDATTRSRALTLAHEARELFSRGIHGGRQSVAEVDAWLADKPR